MPLSFPASQSSLNLAADATFQGRVKIRLAVQCANVVSEVISASTLNLHVRRVQLANQIEQNLTGANAPSWPLIFAIIVAGDATVIGDATGGSVTDVTSGNSGTQQALVTDAHIDNAISANFNVLLSPV
jgi:hypothetical protein